MQTKKNDTCEPVSFRPEQKASAVILTEHERSADACLLNTQQAGNSYLTNYNAGLNNSDKVEPDDSTTVGIGWVNEDKLMKEGWVKDKETKTNND